MTDPIADLLTRIRNIILTRQGQVEVPSSNIKKGIASILKKEGYIRDFEYLQDGKQGLLKIYLKSGNRNAITGLKRISKPGLRVYVNKDELPRVLGGLGIAIISTSQGLMTDHEARRAGLGGEVICYVW
ncbi:MAG: 30S ribosomal protein S8 [Firmicutes bacterium]|jgi:small subunit ribosomal protein S8|nr:30S ribosomal protein S8 [Bacillota bacterium]